MNEHIIATDEKEIILCPKCRGEGVSIRIDRMDMYGSDAHEEDCCYCGGSGKMRKRSIVIHERME